jgi:hypothetical protein
MSAQGEVGDETFQSFEGHWRKGLGRIWIQMGKNQCHAGRQARRGTGADRYVRQSGCASRNQRSQAGIAKNQVVTLAGTSSQVPSIESPS